MTGEEGHDRKRRATERGMTLFELMVTLALTSIGVLGMASMLMTAGKIQRRTKSVGSAQDAAQILAQRITGHLRRSALGAQGGVFMMDSSSGKVEHAALFSELFPCGNVNASAADTLFLLSTRPATPSAVLRAAVDSAMNTNPIPVSNAAGFAISDTVLLTDFRRGSWLRVSGVDAGTKTFRTQEQDGVIEVFPTDSPGYGAGAPVLRAQLLRFGISDGLLQMSVVDPLNKTAPPLRATTIFAGVENLQIRFGLDTVGDGEVDTWRDDLCSDNTTEAANVRQVQVAVVTQTEVPLQTLEGAGDASPAFMNFEAVPKTDGRLRRWTQSTVTVRNLAGVNL